MSIQDLISKLRQTRSVFCGLVLFYSRYTDKHVFLHAAVLHTLFLYTAVLHTIILHTIVLHAVLPRAIAVTILL